MMKTGETSVTGEFLWLWRQDRDEGVFPLQNSFEGNSEGISKNVDENQENRESSQEKSN